MKQYVFLKSGVELRFDTEKVPFLFNEDGYFVNDVEIKLPNDKSYYDVGSFTFHVDQIACSWISS